MRWQVMNNYNVDPDLYVIAVGNIARLKFMINSNKDVEANLKKALDIMLKRN